MSLTSRSYYVLAVICLIGIMGQWGDDSVRYLWRYLTGFWVLLLVYEGWKFKHLAFDFALDVPDTAHLGRECVGRYQLSNSSLTPVVLEFQRHDIDSMLGERPVYSKVCPANQSLSQAFKVLPQHLGLLHWPMVSMQILGSLGLAKWTRKIDFEQQLKVVPDRIHEKEYLTAVQPQGEKKRRHYGYGMEIKHLREYAPGDPLKLIDWKATARNKKPVSRVYNEEQHLEVMLLIDCGYTSGMKAGNITRVNHYINIASRLSQIALLNGDKVGVITYADQVLNTLLPTSGMMGLQKIRKVLQESRTQLTESSPLPAVLHLQRKLPQRCLVVLFTDTDEYQANSLLLNSVRQLRPKHLPLLASLVDEDVEHMQEKPAQTWLDPYESFAAMEVSLASKKLMMHLQRLGCHIVKQKARHLDHAVLSYYGELRDLV